MADLESKMTFAADNRMAERERRKVFNEQVEDIKVNLAATLEVWRLPVLARVFFFFFFFWFLCAIDRPLMA